MESVFKFWKNIERQTRQMLPAQVFPAQVTEVNEDMHTCTVLVNDNVELYDVRLYSVTDKDLKGFCLIPAKDSIVLVGRVANNNELFVCSFSVVDKVLGTIGDNVAVAMDKESLTYKCDKTEIEVKSAELTAKIDGVELEVKGNKIKVKADEIELNGGNNNGLAKVDVVKYNLDEIEKYLTAMNTAISMGFNGVGSGLTAAGPAGAGAYNGAMEGQNIVFKDMENKKVKH
ncbi:MAG: hypothetical protein J1F29_00745 [Lentimicrobiaceae bacterium]|nr:hypothetical protein [Lentimicrobiaceae bacterium]